MHSFNTTVTQKIDFRAKSFQTDYPPSLDLIKKFDPITEENVKGREGRRGRASRQIGFASPSSQLFLLF